MSDIKIPYVQIMSKMDTLIRFISKSKFGDIVLVPVMNASYQFLNDFSSKLNVLNIEHQIACAITLDNPTGRDVVLSKPIDFFHKKHVILLDVVCDSGYTLHILKSKLNGKCSKLTTCVVVDKKHSRMFNVTPNYTLFSIDTNHFLYGYGMDDMKGFNRDLLHIVGIGADE